MSISGRLLLFYFFLLAFQLPVHPSCAGEDGLRKVTLQLKWKHQFQFAGYYAAVEKGYYRDAGLEVNIVEAKENMNPNEEVFSGRADFGISSSEVLVLRARHQDAVILASIFQHSPLVLLALQKSGIKHASDLVGKRISLESNSTEIVAFLNHEGVSLEKCILKDHTFDLDGLIKGEVDAITAYSTDETFSLEEAGIPYVVMSPLMAGLDFYGDVLYTTSELIKAEPELVRKFREASLKGWDYALKNPDEIINLIYNKYSQRLSTSYMAHEAEHMTGLVLKDVVEIGYSNPKRWQHILQIYQAYNLIDKSQTIKGLLYHETEDQGISVNWDIIIPLLIIIGIIAAITLFYYYTSKKLRREIVRRQKVQQELMASEELHRSVLTASPDTIMITDLDGIINFVSPMVFRMFGYHEKDVLGRPLTGFLIERDKPKALSDISQMFAGNFSGAREYTGIRADGVHIPIEVKGEFIRNAEGMPTGIVFVTRNITERKITEEKLKKSQETFKTLVESIDDVIFEVDKEGKITYISPSVERVLGFTPAEMKGKIFFDFIFEADRKELVTREKEMQELKKIILESRFPDKSGTVKWLRSSTRLFFDYGMFTGGIGTLTDLTDRKMAEEKIIKANRIYAFISQINQSMVRIRESHALLEEVCRIGVGTGEFQMVWIGLVDESTMLVEPYVFAGNEKGYLSVIKKISVSDVPEGRGPTGSAIRQGEHYVCNDIESDPRMAIWKEEALSRGYRSLISLPIKQSGKIRGAITFYAGTAHFFDRDEIDLLEEVAGNISFALTAMKADAELKDLYASLETKIEMRTAQLAEANETLQKARQEAEQANLAKSEFLSRMSHELRTPMNSILGFAQLLDMGMLNPAQKKGVGHIMKSGRHLLDLINEVLDISRIEAGRLSLSMEPVQIRGVILEMTDIVRQLALDHEVTIGLVESPDNLLFIWCDKQRLKQILLNLINNAIKYNKTGGEVKLEVTVPEPSSPGSDKVKINIRDTGFGIAEEDLPKLFNPFERIGAEKTETEGTGLGLSVVKKLTDAMGGSVGVESVVGQGSTFWVEFSRCSSPSESDEVKIQVEGLENKLSSRSGTILYIEDNASNIELVNEILTSQRASIRLITNANGLQAVPLALEHHPDLILLDLNLPDIHGSEVLKQLKENELTSTVPVVVISADAMPQQVERLLSAGAENYLTKPLDLSLLLKIIDEHIAG